MVFVSIFIFLLIICSGSFFAYSFFDKKFEETISISFYSVIIISFLLCFFNLLKYSIFLVTIIAIILYVAAIHNLIKNKKTIKVFFNISFFSFIIINLYFIFALYGKYFNAWDEFTHWGDIVKVMCEFDDFGTNPLTTSEFKSYPPGMALLQYFIEKINYIVCGQQFTEWLCNYAYSIFVISSLFWINSKCVNNSLFFALIYLVISVGIPFFFYDYLVFKQLLIDPCLSFLLASLMLDIMWSDVDDKFSQIRILLGIFVIVLIKDTGLIFAIFALLAFTIKQLINLKENNKKRSIIPIVFAFICIAIPKILWNLDITINHANVKFSNSIDLNDLLLTITGKVYSYRTETIVNYFNAFINEKVILENISRSINYIPIFIVAYVGIILISIFASKKKYVSNSTAINSSITLLSLSIVFVFGMCVIYMYKFDESEALKHASFNRYQRIVLLGLYLYVFYSLLIIVNKMNNKIAYALLIGILLFISPIKTIFDFSLRASTITSINIRESYQAIIDETFEKCIPNTKIWFISQGDTGYDIRYYRTSVRPYVVMYNDYYLVNKQDDNDFSKTVSATSWFKQLCEESYDYVALYKLNDSFYDDFSILFENVDEIKENSIYKVNKETMKLSLCK